MEQYLVGAGTFPLPLLSLLHHVVLRLFPFLLLSLILIPDERIISCSESRFSLMFHLLQRRWRASIMRHLAGQAVL